MKWAFRAGQVAVRRAHSQRPHATFKLPSVETGQGHEVNLQAFQQRAFVPQKPLLVKASLESRLAFPAFIKWFTAAPLESGDAATFSPYMEEFHEWPFAYELLLPPGTDHAKSIRQFQHWLLSRGSSIDHALAEMLEPALAYPPTEQRFFQLHGPLKLLVKTLEFNRILSRQALHPIQLYIAQSLISSLPQALQEDVPTPEWVLKAGKGDVYSSSVWLGAEPTYTPLHRDPNPNLFYQLCGHKSLRLLPPAHGDRVFSEVQRRLGRNGTGRIRMAEMMEGKEREMLHRIVWESRPVGEVYGADMAPGDSLFIPKGWWHSVKSVGTEGRLNGSVNWWFR